MPPTLHPHLKRGLDFDDFHTSPEDVVEPLRTEYHDPGSQEAKRRRVEAIAFQYLRGKPPMILSAGLRGPFNQGWKNPWAKKPRKARKIKGKQSGTAAQRSAVGTSTTAQGACIAEGRNRKRKAAVADQKALQHSSPEASRAAGDVLEDQRHDESLKKVEVPLATAPSPDEHGTSGTTEFFSANAEKCNQEPSPLANPSWLRRPESERRFEISPSTIDNIDASPTRSRSCKGTAQARVKRDLHLALPKAPLQTRFHTPNAGLLEDCRSSTSAPVIVSSSKKGLTAIPYGTNADAQVQLSPSSRVDDTAQPPSTRLTSPHANTPKPIESTVRLAQPNRQVSSLTGSQGQLSKKDVQKLAERLVDLMPTPSKTITQHGPQQTASQKAPKHNLIASPAPASSTGFVYRRIGEAKRACANAERPKPRAVDSKSPSAHTQNAISSGKQTSPCVITVQEADSTGKELLVTGDQRVSVHSSATRAQSTVNDVQEEELEPRLSRPSPDSAYSTQAAMLLAQIEFQESSSPTVSSEMGRPWSQPQYDTPRSILPEPSPAITPLSVFGAQLNRSFPNNSVLRGPPISTQDLFGAASPFAFSTVKKKPEVSYQCSLRFPMLLNNDEEARANGTAAKSPTTCSNRIPLKAKNTMTTPLWSLVTEKASQASQGSLDDRSMRSIDDDELPHLDFHPSPDDFGPSGGLHFTDRFLGELNHT
ncbi:hypothetical protein BKA66DRAFT_414798 [Pyrenochaeta sp. MPI-SDFR-AT-0127]|nr:hypothetical protein BKA66DRAFT_414798 [Pyrenochaeta sp. MPI-SDFR-AT-0127]